MLCVSVLLEGGNGYFRTWNTGIFSHSLLNAHVGKVKVTVFLTYDCLVLKFYTAESDKRAIPGLYHFFSKERMSSFFLSGYICDFFH